MRILSLVFLVLLVTCSKDHSSDRLGAPRNPVTFPTSGKTATVKKDKNGVVVATMDPNSKETQLVSASRSSRISGAAIALPPGSISVPMDISLQEGPTVSSASLLSELGIAVSNAVQSAGVPVMISSSVATDLNSPMKISLPLPTGAGLITATVEKNRYAVIYRVQNQTSGENFTGLIPGSAITIQGDFVITESKYFGWFKTVILESPVTTTIQVKSSKLGSLALTTVLTLEDLPACGAGDTGQTVYVKSTSTFKYCDGAAWQDLNLTGPKGDTGAAGTSGSAFKLYKSSDNTSVGNLVTFANGLPLVAVGSSTTTSALVFLNMYSGYYADAPSVGSSGLMALGSIFYSGSNCTSNVGTYYRPMQGAAILLSDGSYRKYTGSGSASSFSYESYYYSGSCANTGSSSGSYYLIDNTNSSVYSMPVTLSGGSLYIGY